MVQTLEKAKKRRFLQKQCSCCLYILEKGVLFGAAKAINFVVQQTKQCSCKQFNIVRYKNLIHDRYAALNALHVRDITICYIKHINMSTDWENDAVFICVNIMGDANFRWQACPFVSHATELTEFNVTLVHVHDGAVWCELRFFHRRFVDIERNCVIIRFFQGIQLIIIVIIVTMITVTVCLGICVARRITADRFVNGF